MTRENIRKMSQCKEKLSNLSLASMVAKRYGEKGKEVAKMMDIDIENLSRELDEIYLTDGIKL